MSKKRKTKRKQEVSIKEIREKFYELRDFEISNLWQRSIFLSALLVILLSGYGILVSKFFEKDTQNFLELHIACVALALLSIIFSIIWIQMAKASKAWYEVYENAICSIENESNKNKSNLYIPTEYRMGEYCKVYGLDSCLLTTKPGAYSPSKLNILIGIVLIISWMIVFITHLSYILKYLLSQDLYLNFTIAIIIVLASCVVLVISLLIIYIFNKVAKSTSLSEK